MHHMIQAVSLALASLISAISAPMSHGQNETQSGGLTNSATAVGKDYAFTIQTDKDSYAPDERITLKVTVKYTGATSANLSMDPGPFYRNTTVLWNDKPCPQTLYYQQAIDNRFNYGHGLGVSPGWEGSHSFHLNRLFDMTRLGEYKILVRREGLEAGPITIHIHDYDPKK